MPGSGCIQHHDPTLVRFLDIFHHRMLSLFYRAWANTEPTVSFDRPHTDRFSDYVGAMAGLGMSSLRKRDEIADLTKFYYCGRLASQTRCAEGLQDILSDYFQPAGSNRAFCRRMARAADAEHLPIGTRSG